MKRNRVFIIPLIIVGVVLFTFLGGEIVKLLWNWLLPPLFGWKQIAFWQALGLLALCRILFGGFGPGKRGDGFRRRQWDRRWEKMTPEEREEMRRHFANRWGCAPPPPDSAPSA